MDEPRPLRLGVTGHRIITDTAALWAGVEEALDRVARGSPVEVLSSLAEGADRMVAEAVLRRAGASLTLVLPLEEADYLLDFGEDGSPSRLHYDALRARAARVISPRPAPDRREGYAEAGRRIVEEADLLIALWDGEPAQGRGGTAEVVELARAAGKGVAIVRTGNRDPESGRPRSLGSEQGRVLVERL